MKVTIAGSACVLTSSLKLSDIKLVEQYRPEALTLRDEEGSPIFATTTGNEHISKFGISFDSETRDENKFATMTIPFTYDGDNVVEYIGDTYGKVITKFNQLESVLPDIISEIKEERQKVTDSITVIQ